MIKIDSLTKTYGEKIVLNNISMIFEKGKVYGIVGANGAGKTTLFRCICGLEEHEGLIITTMGKLKDHAGFLQTEPYFFSRITGREYLQLMCNARNLSLTDFDNRNLFDLPLDTYISAYSTGMKKKLALLGILLQKNDYFILDEPFNGVDIQSNILIIEILQKLKAAGKTVIISSHIFSTLSRTCDKIYLLNGGSFTRCAGKDEFATLEAEMRNQIIGNKSAMLEF